MAPEVIVTETCKDDPYDYKVMLKIINMLYKQTFWQCCLFTALSWENLVFSGLGAKKEVGLNRSS